MQPSWHFAKTDPNPSRIFGLFFWFPRDPPCSSWKPSFHHSKNTIFMIQHFLILQKSARLLPRFSTRRVVFDIAFYWVSLNDVFPLMMFIYVYLCLWVYECRVSRLQFVPTPRAVPVRYWKQREIRVKHSVTTGSSSSQWHSVSCQREISLSSVYLHDLHGLEVVSALYVDLNLNRQEYIETI